MVKALPVNPTDPAVTGPDIFAKLVPMAAHEASSLYRCVPGCGAGGYGSGWSRTAGQLPATAVAEPGTQISSTELSKEPVPQLSLSAG